MFFYTLYVPMVNHSKGSPGGTFLNVSMQMPTLVGCFGTHYEAQPAAAAAWVEQSSTHWGILRMISTGLVTRNALLRRGVRGATYV